MGIQSKATIQPATGQTEESAVKGIKSERYKERERENGWRDDSFLGGGHTSILFSCSSWLPCDPVQISMQEANIFSSTTAMNAGLTNLLQLQEELMTSTELQVMNSQHSPLYKDTNPLLGQTRSSQFTSAAATASSFLAPPLL